MSPSESIQKQLDERGIDYQMHDGGNRVCFYFDYSEQCGDFLKSIDVIGACVIASQSYLTPEQAIAATVGADYGIIFAPTLERPPETMVGETVFDAEDNAIGWISNATVGVGTCRNISDPPSGFLCSECGWGDFNEPTHLLKDANFCPNCGKEIVK